MSDDNIPDPQRLLKLAKQTMSSAERRKKYNKISFWGPSRFYPSQMAYLNRSQGEHHQRILTGGSQSGKTTTCGAEMSFHLSGRYPDWYSGLRFSKPINAWCIGESTSLVRDVQQRILCGAPEFGTGLIVLSDFARKPIAIPGGSGALDTIHVNHVNADGVNDGISMLSFRSYEMGRAKLQSATLDLLWADEKPPREIYSELLARLTAGDDGRGGHALVSFTAIGNDSDGLVHKLWEDRSSDQAIYFIPASETKHISEVRREELAKSYDEAEVATRVHGTPMLGAGPIFPVSLLPGLTRFFDKSEIPPWARHVVGIDFGFAAPFAAVWMAWTPDTQQYWVIDCFKMTGAGANEHARRILAMTEGLRIKVVWPHDGGSHDKGSGLNLRKQYADAGLNMAGSHVTNYAGGITVEPSIQEICTAMRDGKIVFNKSCEELLSEMRVYHRDAKTGKAVDKNQDAVSALRYCFMGRRQGQPLAEYDGCGYGGGAYSGQRRTSNGPRFASGLDFDVFTGE